MSADPAVAVVDYGAGNLASVTNAFFAAGANPVIARDPEALAAADRIVLPGVGAGGAALAALRAGGFDAALDAARRRGTPILGICVGMQMMADSLEEFGTHRGLGWMRGRVARIPDAPHLRVPHMGWAEITPTDEGRDLFAGNAAARHFYFCHSYRLVEDEGVATATVDHGGPFTVAVRFDTVMAVQFHPEKSQVAGRKLIERFLDWRP